MLGKAHTAESIAKMSLAKSDENHPRGMQGKAHSAETLALISKASGTAIYVYSKDKSTLVNSFPSANKAAKEFGCCNKTIKSYALSGLLFKEEWILSTYLITLTEDCSPES
jgi:group I intron endonuclease